METWKPLILADICPTDIVIVLEGCKFHAHKDVLIKNCDYFKAMFASQMSENRQAEINVKIVERDPFQVLVGGFYSGQLQLSEENIFAVSAASHILQVTSVLFSQCCDFLKKLINHERCFEVMDFTAVYPIQDVYSAARRYCLLHFLTLREQTSFLNLSLNGLKDYLSDMYLVVDGIQEILVALKNWNKFNNNAMDSDSLKEVLSVCLHRSEDPKELEDIALAIVNEDDFSGREWVHLGLRSQMRNIFMFWARHSKTRTKGLVDVIKLADLESGQDVVRGSRFDTMTDIVQDPGFDLGSAVCVKGPFVYVCGGGPTFGRLNWIRDVWQFSAFEDRGRWKAIGKLPETRRYHAMVALEEKLFVFGGFGKFRSKNSSLDSFDIKTGSWQSLAPMPKHEFKPIATSHHQAIYYITQEWQVYKYCLLSDQWSNCQELKVLKKFKYPQRGNDLCPPMALHITSSRLTFCLIFTVLSGGQSFQIVSYPSSDSKTSVTQQVDHMKYTQQVDHMKYFGSYSMNGKVFIFLKMDSEEESDDDDDDDEQEENTEERKNSEIQVLLFDPDTGQLKEVTKVVQVNKASAILPIPFVPRTFKFKQADVGLSL